MVNVLKSESTYQLFSRHYEALTYDLPYNLWLDIIDHFKAGRQSVLDIGCGTGRLTSQLDFDKVTGMDQSPQMIEEAKSKKMKGISFLTGDMLNFNLDERFDMAIATVDVMNYCKDACEVERVLQNVYNHLNQGGIFLFDIHSVYKMEHDFNDMTYSDETDHITYIWHAIAGEQPLSVIHDMTFFVKEEDGDTYHRISETHEQRTYKHKEMIRIVNQTNFSILASFSDFSIDNPVTDICDRVFYVLKK